MIRMCRCGHRYLLAIPAGAHRSLCAPLVASTSWNGEHGELWTGIAQKIYIVDADRLKQLLWPDKDNGARGRVWCAPLCRTAQVKNAKSGLR